MARLAELVVPFLKTRRGHHVQQKVCDRRHARGSMLFAAAAFAQGQPIVGISTVTT
jgi:hypothetical protein